MFVSSRLISSACLAWFSLVGLVWLGLVWFGLAKKGLPAALATRVLEKRAVALRDLHTDSHFYLHLTHAGLSHQIDIIDRSIDHVEYHLRQATR